MPDIAGLPARKAALQVLDAVLRRGETMDLALPRATARLRGADAALARAIAAETLRWLRDLDDLIDSATRQNLADDAKVRTVLRLMLVQALRLDTPPHAVVSTGLELLTGGPRRLAHGVFSTLTKRGASLPDTPSLPESVAERWQTQWPNRIGAISQGLVDPPPLDIVLRDSEAESEWAERLGAEPMGGGRLRLPRGHAVTDVPGYDEGAWWVQDFAATLPAALLGKGEGRRVLDLCAAPGGKTLQLAAAGWNVTALDISKRRLERLRDNLRRTGLSAQIVTADALDWTPEGAFDAILLDAPCSATGTCRRHPDVLHRFLPARLGELTDLQQSLADRATDWLKPGGMLVYAVCSMEREEGEDRALALSNDDRLKPAPIGPDELPAPISPTAEGWLRTDPGLMAGAGGMDGFFAARFTRR